MSNDAIYQGEEIGMTNITHAAISEFDDIQELQGFVVLPLGDAWDLEVYAFTGFTDSSPEWGAGITIAADLRRLAFRRDR